MGIAIKKTVLVNGSAAVTGSVFAEDTDTYHIHRFFVTLQNGTSATLLVQGSYDGSNWCTHGTVNTAGTTCVEVDRAWSNLRVSWTGNTSSKTVLVQLEQMYSNSLGAI